MKKGYQEQNTKIIFLAQKLLSVHYSGMYLTGFDIATIADKIGYDSIVGNREEMMVGLLNYADEEGKLGDISTYFSSIVEDRCNHYENLRENYPQAVQSINPWILKARNVHALFTQAQHKSPYDA
jgi:hypothetical protein